MREIVKNVDILVSMYVNSRVNVIDPASIDLKRKELDKIRTELNAWYSELKIPALSRIQKSNNNIDELKNKLNDAQKRLDQIESVSEYFPAGEITPNISQLKADIHHYKADIEASIALTEKNNNKITENVGDVSEYKTLDSISNSTTKEVIEALLNEESELELEISNINNHPSNCFKRFKEYLSSSDYLGAMKELETIYDALRDVPFINYNIGNNDFSLDIAEIEKNIDILEVKITDDKNYLYNPSFEYESRIAHIDEIISSYKEQIKNCESLNRDLQSKSDVTSIVNINNVVNSSNVSLEVGDITYLMTSYVNDNENRKPIIDGYNSLIDLYKKTLSFYEDEKIKCVKLASINGSKAINEKDRNVDKAELEKLKNKISDLIHRSKFDMTAIDLYKVINDRFENIANDLVVPDEIIEDKVDTPIVVVPDEISFDLSDKSDEIRVEKIIPVDLGNNNEVEFGPSFDFEKSDRELLKVIDVIPDFIKFDNTTVEHSEKPDTVKISKPSSFATERDVNYFLNDISTEFVSDEYVDLSRVKV